MEVPLLPFHDLLQFLWAHHNVCEGYLHYRIRVKAALAWQFSPHWLPKCSHWLHWEQRQACAFAKFDQEWASWSGPKAWVGIGGRAACLWIRYQAHSIWLCGWRSPAWWGSCFTSDTSYSFWSIGCTTQASPAIRRTDIACLSSLVRESTLLGQCKLDLFAN